MNIEIAPFPVNKPLPKWLGWFPKLFGPCSFELVFDITWCAVRIRIIFPYIIHFEYNKIMGYKAHLFLRPLNQQKWTIDKFV